jgi:hypothetical protein
MKNTCQMLIGVSKLFSLFIPTIQFLRMDINQLLKTRAEEDANLIQRLRN